MNSQSRLLQQMVAACIQARCCVRSGSLSAYIREPQQGKDQQHQTGLFSVVYSPEWRVRELNLSGSVHVSSNRIKVV